MCWCAALLTLVAVLVLPPGGWSRQLDMGRAVGRPYTRLEFRGLRCAGTFDRSMVARLTIVCRDCYNVYKEPELFGLCRQECFSTRYFTGCLNALKITDPVELARHDEAARVIQG